MNNLESWAFLIFGIGFFIFVIYIVLRDDRQSWERRMMEAREFGFRDKNQLTDKSPPEK